MVMNVRIDSAQVIQSDVLADDSDKSFTVPAESEWDLTHVRVELTSTATAGNRRVAVEVQDGSSNVLAIVQAGLVQAESLGPIGYNFGPGLADQTTLVNGNLNTALPKIRLRPGDVLRVYDIAAIDAAADDMDVRVMVNTNRI